MPALKIIIKVIRFSKDWIKCWLYLNIPVGMLLKALQKDFFLTYVFLAFNDSVSKWVTQCEKSTTMDLRFFFFLVVEVDGEERVGISPLT